MKVRRQIPSVPQIVPAAPMVLLQKIVKCQSENVKTLCVGAQMAPESQDGAPFISSYAGLSAVFSPFMKYWRANMFAHFDCVVVIQPNKAGKCQDAATLDLVPAPTAVILVFLLFEFKSQYSGDLKPEHKAFLVYRHKSWHCRHRKDLLLSLVCSCTVLPWLGVNKFPISYNKIQTTKIDGFRPETFFFLSWIQRINAHILE